MNSKSSKSRFEAALQQYRSQLPSADYQPSALAARLSLPRAKPATSKGSSTTASPEPEKDLKHWRDYCKSLAVELAEVKKQHRELVEAREKDREVIEGLRKELEEQREVRGTERLFDGNGPLRDLATNVIGLRTLVDRVQDEARKRSLEMQKRPLSQKHIRANSCAQNTKFH